MNDKEIRLKVLSMLYANEKEGKPAPGTINDIEGLSLDEYRWASYYLITHNLADGSMNQAGGHKLAWAEHISVHGIDVIESLIDKSIEKAEKTKISVTSQSSSHLEKLIELGIIWSKNPDLYKGALEFLTKLVE